MRSTETTVPSHSGPEHYERYEIRLAGQIDGHWTAWFGGLSVRPVDDGTTVIAGSFADQAALHGVLRQVRDLGVPLISVVPIGNPPLTEPPTTNGSPNPIQEDT